jgi:hypothetical protein
VSEIGRAAKPGEIPRLGLQIIDETETRALTAAKGRSSFRKSVDRKVKTVFLVGTPIEQLAATA